MRPGGARLKGQRHERAVAKKFNAQIPSLEAKRGIGQSRGGGAEVPDIVIPHLHVECKHRRTVSMCHIREAVKQSSGDCPSDKTPCVVVRQNNRADLLVMELDTFIKLFGEFLSWKEGTSLPPSAVVTVTEDEVRVIATKRELPPPHPKTLQKKDTP